MYTRRETCLIASRWLSFLPANPAIDARPLAIPFTFASGRGSILVRARIDRRDAVLIVDTGSTHTILRPSVAGVDPAELAQPRVGPGIVGDAVGREVNLEVGTYVSRRRVSVMDLSLVLSVYTEKIDGLLGIDFLLDFSRTVIDLKTRIITFIR